MALQRGVGREVLVGKQVGEGVGLAKGGVVGEGGLVDEAHHVAVQVAVSRTSEVNLVAALVAVGGVERLELYLVASHHVDADGVRFGLCPTAVVLLIEEAQKAWIADGDDAVGDGLHRQRCRPHVTVGLSGVLHRPPFGYPVEAALVAVVGRCFDEGATGRHTLHPALEAKVGRDVGGQALHGFQTGAACKHVAVAKACQPLGGQCGRCLKAGAIVEQAMVAAISQRSGRQFWTAGEGGTARKHIHIAVRGQRGGGQKDVLRGVVADGGVRLREESAIFVSRCAEEVGEVAASAPLAFVGQFLQCGEASGVDEAHHVAVEIDGVGGCEASGLLARIAKTKVTRVVASELHRVSLVHTDADGVGGGGCPSGSVFVVLNGQSVGIDDVDGASLYGL